MLDGGARERPTYPEGPEKGRPSVLAIIALVGVLTLVGFGLIAYLVADRLTQPSSSRTVIRPTGTILMAVKDLARLETNELHMEKEIDLTDKQSRFFGLIGATD